MTEEPDRGAAQNPPSGGKGEGWGWFLAELFGDFIPEPGWLLAGALLVLLLVAAAFSVIIFDSFDRTPLQTLGLK
jgi:hypothetical protein